MWHTNCTLSIAMITLTRLNGTRICVNAFLIEHVEATPDTVVTLTNGHRFVVRETPDELVDLAVEYLARLRAEGADPVAMGQLGRVS